MGNVWQSLSLKRYSSIISETCGVARSQIFNSKKEHAPGPTRQRKFINFGDFEKLFLSLFILSSFFLQTNQHKFRHQIWYYHNASNYRTFQLCAFKSTSPKYFQPATLSKVKLWLLLVMMIFWILLQLFLFIKMKNKRISKIVAHLKCLYILKYF